MAEEDEVLALGAAMVAVVEICLPAFWFEIFAMIVGLYFLTVLEASGKMTSVMNFVFRQVKSNECLQEGCM